MELDSIFEKQFNGTPDYHFDCGGRFEILGNHTDHNHGLCLAATASLCITAALSKNNTQIISVDSIGFTKFDVDLSTLEYNDSENKSAAMIRGVAKYLIDNGYKIGGFNAVLNSTIFPGAGVSSSAAFELLIGQIFNELFNDGKIDKITLAKAGQFSENYYYGKASGLLDQIGVAFGNIVQIDFEDIKNPKVLPVDFPFNDLTFVGVNTGGDHSLMNSLYSQIPVDMKSAAKKMGVEFLRESTLENLMNTEGLTEVEKSRSIHFYAENERVKTAIEAIKNKNKKLFLEQVNGSRESSTFNLRNMMVEGKYEGSPLEACDLAMKFLGDKGACKINGGGFAGSIICVVPNEMVSDFISLMSNKYGENNVVQIDVRKYGPRSF